MAQKSKRTKLLLEPADFETLMDSLIDAYYTIVTHMHLVGVGGHGSGWRRWSCQGDWQQEVFLTPVRSRYLALLQRVLGVCFIVTRQSIGLSLLR
jgi:hypothetical protein